MTVRRIEKCGLSFARAGEFLPGDLLIAPSSCLEKEKVLCLPEEVDELGAPAPEDLRGAMVDRVGLVDRVVVFVWERESRHRSSWRIGAFFSLESFVAAF